MVTICILDIFLPSLEPICCSMFSSNCCLLTCVRQEASKVVWYSHLFQNFPQFVVIHTVKGFSIVNQAQVEFFWNSLAFCMIQWMLAIWFLVSLFFLNPTCTSESSQFMYCWSLAWRILSITLLSSEMSRQCIKEQRHHFANNSPYSQSSGFSSSHVQMW